MQKLMLSISIFVNVGCISCDEILSVVLVDIGVPGRSNLGGRRPVARKNFLLISKKTSKICQKNAKIRAFCPNFGVLPEFFQRLGGCRPPSPLGKYAYARR